MHWQIVSYPFCQMAETRRRSTRLRVSATSSEPVGDESLPYANLTVVELKQELRNRGLKLTGLKSELVSDAIAKPQSRMITLGLKFIHSTGCSSRGKRYRKRRF